MKNLNSLKAVAVAFLICTAFASCRKKDRIEVTTPQLVKVEQGDGSYLAFAYNANKSVSKITTSDVDYLNETLITYDNQNKPILANGGTHQLKFIYENGKLKRINTLLAETQDLVAFLEFTYTNERLTQTLVSANINGNIIGETKLNYTYYPNGDVQQTTVTSLDPEDNTWSVFSIHRFEYDQHINPLVAASPFLSSIEWNPSSHNIVKEVVLEANETLRETITTTYTYDTKTKLPLTATEKTMPADGEPSTITKKFIYQ